MSTHPDPEQLSAYIDGELTGTDRDDLEQHLTGCSDCSATLRALRATVADMRALPQPVPSEQASWALRSAITKARRRPAVLYRRVVQAVGGAAAAAVVIIALTFLGRTASSTFSHTGTCVGSDCGAAAAPAPQAAASVPVMQIDPTNYNQTSATQLFDSYRGIHYLGPVNSGNQGTAASGGTKSASATDRSQYAAAIATCENIVLSKGSGGARPIAYIIGRYDGTPAFFLIYTVLVGGKSKTEMWVVRQSDCYIRLFIAPR